jgi:transcription elongation GreA/GreB family factor
VLVDKAALRDALLAELERQRNVMVEAQRLSSEGVTHADAKAEGSKDMRATEASYIARGQALRVEDLDTDAARVRSLALRDYAPGEAIGLCAVVSLIDDRGSRQRVFVAPAGGGTRLSSAVGEIQVVTPQSPLGRALLGAAEGDWVEVDRAGASVEVQIEEAT